ncbi:diaminopimelate decarboxylase [Azotosporobacter soli]|uniref:diaminopimelate decarboxylase family protein n=1 Tax=Azotosporobacter soli TaxID=3055040 RepID=UPI0031FE9E36
MKTLPLASETLLRIAKKYPTPFYLYDENAIRQNARRLQAAFAWNRGYREFFSVKCNPNPALLSIFKEEGCGVDCASETELLLARACGFSGDDIMFTSNNTTAAEFRLARELDAIINLDDTGHLDFLQRVASLPERISCRYNPGIEIRYQNQCIIDFAGSKFGATKEQISAAFRSLPSQGIKTFGIHAQFGCHRREADYFGSAIRCLFSFAIELFQSSGIKVSFINFAGGLGIPYRPGEDAADIAAVSAAIQAAYDEIIVPSALHPLALFSELGLYMTGPYGYFVSSVLHIKETDKQFAGLDASTNAFLSPLRYNDYHHISVPGKEAQPFNQRYDITGALCENRDRFAVDRELPTLVTGDILVFHDAGAYGYSHSTTFNGKLRPAELLLTAEGSVKTIRRAETPQDYFATLSFDGR